VSAVIRLYRQGSRSTVPPRRVQPVPLEYVLDCFIDRQKLGQTGSTGAETDRLPWWCVPVIRVLNAVGYPNTLQVVVNSGPLGSRCR
jgi:hypothetical protein